MKSSKNHTIKKLQNFEIFIAKNMIFDFSF